MKIYIETEGDEIIRYVVEERSANGEKIVAAAVRPPPLEDGTPAPFDVPPQIVPAVVWARVALAGAVDAHIRKTLANVAGVPAEKIAEIVAAIDAAKVAPAVEGVVAVDEEK